MPFFFLQTDTTATASPHQMQSLWDIFLKGGVIMIPLALLFVAAVFFFIERLIAIRKAGKIEDNFMSINVGVLEMYKMEKNLPVLSIIARIAPLFGFLGTIVGMLQLFKGIAGSSEYNFNTIADGIYVKMITSATGLIIGILTFIAHSYLTAQINHVENKMDVASAEFIDILQEPTK